ncbi:MAG: Gfo/Idh/MocA family oxidoreductase [Planctomycetota bacterium]
MSKKPIPNSQDTPQKKTNPMNPTRRAFVGGTAAAGVGFWVAGGVQARPSRMAIDEISFACVGIDGKGSSDSQACKDHGNVVAICDIDDQKMDNAKEKFGDIPRYNDYREMFDFMGDRIDAFTVSTPDHTHAVIALHGMRMKKHCFCQKPLTHSIEEARMMGQVAREQEIVTQMGNQGTAESALRQSAALIRAGIVGTVKEVHVWTNRPVWPQSIGLEVAEPEVPAHVHWDHWIGPAERRPYSPEIHPFKWRGFWAFGTGALGDMACHTLNMSYMALDLKFPTSVVAEAKEHDGICYPESSKIKFEFPEYEGRAALQMHWYDGGERPAPEILEGIPKRKDRQGRERHYTSAALIIGEDGRRFFSPGDYGADAPEHTGLIDPDGNFTRLRRIEMEADWTQSPGHFTEFANAINGEGTPVSNFPDYAGPLSETILLGNLAVWSGEEVEWDAENMIAKDASEDVEKIIRHDYLNGYTIHV